MKHINFGIFILLLEPNKSQTFLLHCTILMNNNIITNFEFKSNGGFCTHIKEVERVNSRLVWPNNRAGCTRDHTL